ncbi:MAG TPA: nucleotide pyrophosphohydrolase [Desulfobacterales bacterium]|nr:nucleotide pyrophosphohydrolase [Desulfobacterales bacterium]
MQLQKNIFSTFCHTISQLRSDKGCPWDKKQTCSSLKKYLKEEYNELISAIDENDPAHLCEEIGDVLFLLVLLSQINSETKSFTIDDVLNGINNKMIRRHPHVFAGGASGDEEFLKKQWQKIKSQEKAKKIN